MPIQKKLLRLLLGIFIGVLGSILILFLLNNRDGKKDFSFKKIFSINTLSRLTRVYDIIMDGIPDEEKSLPSNVLRALRSGNTLYEELFQVRRIDKFLKFIEEEGYQVSENKFLLPLIRQTRLGDLVKINNNAFDLGNGQFVTSLTFPDEDKIYMSSIVDEEDGSNNRRRSREGDGTIALSPGFNVQSKLDMFWKFYGGGIFVRCTDPYENADFSEHSENLSIEDLNCIDYKFYGKSKNQAELFVKKLAKFRENKIQRSYLLLGRPGTGKSTFCIEISRKISNRVIKISADLFRRFDRNDIDFIFKCLRPDTVIIDDFDRVYDDMEDADILFFFEQLKTNYENVIVFCTVNEIKKLGTALIRPGRFDEILVFNLPDAKERKLMLESFITDLGIETAPSVEEMKQLVTITEGFSPAYLREYCLQLKYEPNFKELVRRIKMTKEFVDMEDFGSGDLEE